MVRNKKREREGVQRKRRKNGWWLQFSSVAQSCPTLCDPMNHSTPGLPVHHQLPEFTQTHVHWVGDAIQPSHPLSSPSPPALNLSQHQGLLKWISSSYQLAKYWSFGFSISPSNDYSGLISFRIDWLGLLAVQGTLKSLLQYHSSKTSILRHRAFFTVQLSHPYMTTWKTMPLTRWTFVDKVKSLLFNMLSTYLGFLEEFNDAELRMWSKSLWILWGSQDSCRTVFPHVPSANASRNSSSHWKQELGTQPIFLLSHDPNKGSQSFWRYWRGDPFGFQLPKWKDFQTCQYWISFLLWPQAFGWVF